MKRPRKTTTRPPAPVLPDSVDRAKLEALAALADADLGSSEEDVKIRFAVPLLEALGHTRMRFEHKGKDILLRDGLPRGSTVVVETKRPDLPLDPHLAQLERYAAEERALLAVLTNGRRLRVYAPLWNRARSFPESLVTDIARADLADPRFASDLANLLSHTALKGRWVLAALLGRQAAIERVWQAAEDIRKKHHDRRLQLQQRLRKIAEESAKLAEEQRACEHELGQLGPLERDALRALFAAQSIPIVPRGEFADLLPDQGAAAALASPALRSWRRPKGQAWTEADFRENATPYQQKILAAFVRLGRRTLSIKEIARRVGLSPQTAAAALSGFTRMSTKWGRKPLFEHRKSSADQRAQEGHVYYSIAIEHWPTIQRLYRKK